MRSAGRVLLLGAVAFQPLAQLCDAVCPNMCSGHGDCSTSDNRCSCHVADRHTDTHWIGGDCSLRECPKGKAWADLAQADNTAHNALAECSNQGTCDYHTGNCVCRRGFMGIACQRMACPNDCSGQGVCVSMDYNARAQGNLAGVAVYATSAHKYDAPWDHDMIYGCACDTGFTGYDCAQRLCPTGDDPLTLGQVNEQQTVSCTCASSTCDGTFTIAFRGKTSKRIKETATQQEVLAAVNALSTIGAVMVTFAGSAACNAPAVGTPHNILIEFTKDFGNLPDVSVASTTGAVVTMAETQKGTKEEIMCANRGICDYATGVCQCNTGYGSSDGTNAVGSRGDCGHLVTTIGTCPTSASGAVCSGHGACSNNPVYKCTCDSGWDGSDCSLRRCPKGRAWFDVPSAADTAHADDTECSNVGHCNTATGKCECHFLYHGSACQFMACPGTDTTKTASVYTDACSGHGTCLDMAHLAEFNRINGELVPRLYGEDPNDNLRWDGTSMHGCLCDAGFTGYDCSQRQCPRGDDPMTGGTRTYTQEDEQRHFKCTYSSIGGTFSFTFRSAKTVDLLHTSTRAQVEAALLKLVTINKVTVEFSAAADQACTTSGDNVITVTFVTEHGGSVHPDAYSRTVVPALPRMTTTVDSNGFVAIADGWSSGSITAGDAASTVFTDVPGTKEYDVCSDRGLCNWNTGICECFLGYGSSNGQGQEGRVGDCGYVEPIMYKDGATYLRSK